MAGQATWWVLAGASAVLVAVSGLAEHLRTRRRNLDRPGWVPWALIQVLAGIFAVVALALALRS